MWKVTIKIELRITEKVYLYDNKICALIHNPKKLKVTKKLPSGSFLVFSKKIVKL